VPNKGETSQLELAPSEMVGRNGCNFELGQDRYEFVRLMLLNQGRQDPPLIAQAVFNHLFGTNHPKINIFLSVIFS
jgi:hypothetical protein